MWVCMFQKAIRHPPSGKIPWDLKTFKPQTAQARWCTVSLKSLAARKRILPLDIALLLMLQKSSEKTTWDVSKILVANNRMNYQPQLVGRISFTGTGTSFQMYLQQFPGNISHTAPEKRCGPYSLAKPIFTNVHWPTGRCVEIYTNFRQDISGNLGFEFSKNIMAQHPSHQSGLDQTDQTKRSTVFFHIFQEVIQVGKNQLRFS